MTTTATPASAARPASTSPTQPNRELDVVDRVAEALRSHGIEAVVVDTEAEARQAVLARVPEGAEVHSGKSKTIEDLGLFAELMESGRYDAVRPKPHAPFVSHGLAGCRAPYLRIRATPHRLLT